MYRYIYILGIYIYIYVCLPYITYLLESGFWPLGTSCAEASKWCLKPPPYLCLGCNFTLDCCTAAAVAAAGDRETSFVVVIDGDDDDEEATTKCLENSDRRAKGSIDKAKRSPISRESPTTSRTTSFGFFEVEC